MVIKKNTYNPNYATHPGEHIEEIILARGSKKREVAERLGISAKHLSQIIHGEENVSPELSIALERVLGISATIWNNLNSNYIIFKAKMQESNSLEKLRQWVKAFPLNELKKFKIINDSKDFKNNISEILNFFGVKSAEVWEEIYPKKLLYYRKSNSFKSNDKTVLTWLRKGEIEADKMDLKEYSEKSFEETLKEIRNLTLLNINDVSKKMIKLCALAGVALVFFPEFKGASISGITEWLSPKKALIQMSLRHKTNDHFWFTFFHESAHILLHQKKEVFIDIKNDNKTNQEVEADNFARNILIPENEYLRFKEESFKLNKNKIINFSKEQKIHPGITLGMIQHDRIISYKWFNDLKVGVDFK